jgi:hypothetical protein
MIDNRQRGRPTEFGLARAGATGRVNRFLPLGGGVQTWNGHLVPHPARVSMILVPMQKRPMIGGPRPRHADTPMSPAVRSRAVFPKVCITANLLLERLNALIRHVEYAIESADGEWWIAVGGRSQSPRPVRKHQHQHSSVFHGMNADIRPRQLTFTSQLTQCRTSLRQICERCRFERRILPHDHHW